MGKHFGCVCRDCRGVVLRHPKLFGALAGLWLGVALGLLAWGEAIAFYLAWSMWP